MDKVVLKGFQFTGKQVLNEPILKYFHSEKTYDLFKDTSKYAWAHSIWSCYRWQIRDYSTSNNLYHCFIEVVNLTFTALTKEAYAIYISLKKLTVYIGDSKITVRSDHLPLKWFLGKNTLKSKVNNLWVYYRY